MSRTTPAASGGIAGTARFGSSAAPAPMSEMIDVVPIATSHSDASSATAHTSTPSSTTPRAVRPRDASPATMPPANIEATTANSDQNAVNNPTSGDVIGGA